MEKYRRPLPIAPPRIISSRPPLPPNARRQFKEEEEEKKEDWVNPRLIAQTVEMRECRTLFLSSAPCLLEEGMVPPVLVGIRKHQQATVSATYIATRSTFLYFGYTYTMLGRSMQLKYKTAERAGVGKLRDHRLDFNTFSSKWQGNLATVVPTPNHYVWGALWRLDECDKARLDEQKGVPQGVYTPIEVVVEDLRGCRALCRTYRLCDQPIHQDPIPCGRFPSKVYMDKMIEGAVESRLPEDYVRLLKAVQHNGFDGNVVLEESEC